MGDSQKRNRYGERAQQCRHDIDHFSYLRLDPSVKLGEEIAHPHENRCAGGMTHFSL